MGGRSYNPKKREPMTVKPIRALIDARKHKLPESHWNIREDSGGQILAVIGNYEVKEVRGRCVIYRNGKRIAGRDSLPEARSYVEKLIEKR